jgi:hypothetical protein
MTTVRYDMAKEQSKKSPVRKRTNLEFALRSWRWCNLVETSPFRYRQLTPAVAIILTKYVAFGIFCMAVYFAQTFSSILSRFVVGFLKRPSSSIRSCRTGTRSPRFGTGSVEGVERVPLWQMSKGLRTWRKFRSTVRVSLQELEFSNT